MRLWRGRGHSLELVLAFAAVLTLGPFAQAASAEAVLPSLDGTLDAVAQATGRTDPTPEPTPDPTPTPTPEPTPDPTPTPTPEPTPDPTPTPTPDPTPAPTPDATPTPTTGATSGSGSDGLSLTLQSGGAGESFIGDSGQSTSGGASKVGVSVKGGADSWIQSVASILDELAATEDGVVRAAEGTPRCPGSECGSASDAIGSGTFALVLICAILAVAGTLAIRAGMRRSNMYSPR